MPCLRYPLYVGVLRTRENVDLAVQPGREQVPARCLYCLAREGILLEGLKSRSSGPMTYMQLRDP